MAWWDKLGRGIKVERAADAIASEALFTVAGGKVLITALVGEITEIVAATGATCNTQLRAVPTTGANTDLCVATNIDTYDVGNILGMTGIPTDALFPAVEHASIPGMTTDGIIAPIGTIDLVSEAVNTGIIAWTLFYIPIDEGASVVAA